jgi:hypothetical protein
MASVFPGAIDSYLVAEVQPAQIAKSAQMRLGLDAAIAIETILGTNPQGGEANVRDSIAAAKAVANNAAASAFAAQTDATQALADAAAADANANSRVAKAGDLMTGDLILPNIGVARVVAPQAAIHVGTFGTSGTVDPLAIILGRPDGTENIGSRAVITGLTNKAPGSNAFVGGWNNEASGSQASAVGSFNVASGLNSRASGENCTANGQDSVAGGDGSLANGVVAYAHGSKAVANQDGARVVTDSVGYETTVDAANQYKLRFQNGWKLVKGGGGDNLDGPEYAIGQESIATTDATPTVLQSVATPNDSVILVESRVISRRTGGAAGANGDCYVEVRHARLKNVGGVLTILQGAAFIQGDQAWTHLWVVNGATAELQVTGAVDNDVTWHTSTKVQRLF